MHAVLTCINFLVLAKTTLDHPASYSLLFLVKGLKDGVTVPPIFLTN